MKELTLEAKVENINAVTVFIDEQLEAQDSAMKAQMQIDVVIDEIFGNIAHYAYAPGSGEATVQFDFDPDARMACVCFIDSGVAYNPLEAKTPDTTLAAEDREIGGLGIFLVRKTMDDVTYERKDGKNILRLFKKI